MIKFKKDILKELKRAGYSGYRLNKEKIIGNSSQAAIRAGQGTNFHTLGRICELLHCQPGDLIEWVDDTEQAESPGHTEH